MKESIEKIVQFAKQNYDMDDNLIKVKMEHTLNVCLVIVQMAKMMNLTEEDINLAFHLALFHDLGRFEEAKRTRKFSNVQTDHALYSNKILFNNHLIEHFPIEKKNYDLIRDAVFYHNKQEVPYEMNERNLFFCNLLRDADRIDILRVIYTRYKNNMCFDDMPSQYILNAYLNKESMDVKNVFNNSDLILLRLNFIQLFKFRESFMVLDELGYLDNFVNSVVVDDKYHDLFGFLVDLVKDHMKGELGHVRKKV